MRSNQFQEALRQNGSAFGHMVMEFGSRGMGRILDAAQPDFVVVDMEHSGFDAADVANQMAWFRGARFAPFVRVPQTLYHFIARVMDAGALGIMVPNVETPEQAKQVVDAVKYMPLGKRGVGLGTAHTDYVQPPDASAYLREANENTTVICQIESPLGIANAASIAALEGVDCLWVGHFDLTQAMGITGQFQNKLFLDAVEKVVAETRAAGKVAGIQPGTLEQARQWWDMGFRVISWASDIAVFRTALQEGLQSLRALRSTKV